MNRRGTTLNSAFARTSQRDLQLAPHSLIAGDNANDVVTAIL
jgi:hypothetical protein